MRKQLFSGEKEHKARAECMGGGALFKHQPCFRGPEDHVCHVRPVPGASLPAEMNACLLPIMGAAEEGRTQFSSAPLSCWGKARLVP